MKTKQKTSYEKVIELLDSKGLSCVSSFGGNNNQIEDIQIWQGNRNSFIVIQYKNDYVAVYSPVSRSVFVKDELKAIEKLINKG